MSEDWKNDRAESAIKEQELKNMAKAAAEFKAKQVNQRAVGEWAISITATGEKSKETLNEFVDALMKLQKDFTRDNVTCEIDPTIKFQNL